ncbi:MAG: hypothetical protein ACM31L_07665 [Actinomycetota bacterium]
MAEVDSPARPVGARSLQFATTGGMMAVTVVATVLTLIMTFFIGGAFLMNGSPHAPPMPISLYLGLAVAALSVPGLVSLVLKAIGRGAGVVAVIQSLLVLTNAAFWGVFLLEVMVDFP